MPYIKPEHRFELDDYIDKLYELVPRPENKDLDGQLNYIISSIVTSAFAPEEGDWSYHNIARAIAVFECAKLEFYRRVAAPKEDRAIQKNGDIVGYQ